MLQGEHSAILSTFIKLPFVIKIFVLSIFEWPFYTGFTVSVRHFEDLPFEFANSIFQFLKIEQCRLSCLRYNLACITSISSQAACHAEPNFTIKL